MSGRGIVGLRETGLVRFRGLGFMFREFKILWVQHLVV